MAEDLVYRNSRWRSILLMAVGLAFVAAGVFMIVAAGKWTLGLLEIFFFGACAAVGAWQFIDQRPRLRITDDGILDRTLGVGLIKWADIDGAYLQSIRNHNFICLVLRNEASYLGQLSPLKKRLASANQALGFTNISLNLSGVAVNPGQLLEYILKQAAAVRVGQSGFSLN